MYTHMIHMEWPVRPYMEFVYKTKKKIEFGEFNNAQLRSAQQLLYVELISLLRYA